ncbi:MAG: putative membrane protein [Saprospiraceae bacterium]|jgi:uncharacterized membrane protein
MEGIGEIWVFQLLGRLHPLIVHFPIGLLVVALFLEMLTLKGKRPGLREGINWMVNIGAFSAVLASILGYLLKSNGDYVGELVDQHQYLGIATSLLSVVTALLLRRTLKGAKGTFTVYRAMLVLTIITLTIAGHFGASLTHGADYLTSVLPNSEKAYDSQKGSRLLSELNPLDSLSEAQQEKLNMEVRAILAHNCYQCHSENKQKGDLVLENKRGVFSGGESGVVIVAGHPAQSELYKRITLSPDDDDVMPKKGKVLKNDEIALIKLWIAKGAYWSDRALKVFPEAPLALTKPDLPASSKEVHPVDQLMGEYFTKNKVDWPELVDDRTFIRRAYLDIIGLLPEPENIEQFVNNSNSKKRTILIDELLNDTHNYTEHWLSFWNDLLRNDYSGTGFITGGRKQITEWLYNSLSENKSYDKMVQELVNPSPASEGFIKGIEWRGVVNASQRTEMQAAQNIGQSLMGVNVKCASCHNSFVSNLTLEQSYGFASIFAEEPMELNRCDIPIGKMAQVNFLYKELGSIEADSLRERLLKLSEIIVKPENGRLYRTISNRIWKRLLGRGIVESVDEMDNPPWDADLLDWLAGEFIDSGHDLKQLIRTIMTSKSYQLPSVRYKNLEQLKSSKYVFHGPSVRRLSAEQFADAVSQVIAPVYYAAAFDPNSEGLTANRFWHREQKFDRDVLPEPGERFFRYEFELSFKELEQASAIISVDHSYSCYLNGTLIADGDDWRKVATVDIKPYLHSGKNILAIKATNEGDIANPAGILFAMKVVKEGGIEQIIQFPKGKGWLSIDVSPLKDWQTLEFDDSGWNGVKNYGDKHWDKLVGFRFEEGVKSYARASLVRQHPFMKALGRPSRENVATSRDEQATLLQALELTNGAFFNKVLEEGALSWLEQYDGNMEPIVDSLYLKSLGRTPNKKERKIMLSALGEEPKVENVQDLFWATLLLPEFQFIY